ncbi:DNA-3-methyladenine glycosylase [Brachybacterium sp. EF45031]|uniref:DNA-3-methyladenine glycosylase n=1 Tax=Brachybacterium sillae TaxID=2810536 RepID=UPI00217DA357|nr:DNA-3-methyladenine glycosylase [Brachybacterium sillae]MCS6712173.1 DNA-3-methyladenine glycosylase [Brachybacterium sillae]
MPVPHPRVEPLPRRWFDRPVLELAPLLLGCELIGRGVRLRITEVEAYVGALDPGSHAYRGRTARNATMFGPPGHLYVYRHMGLHVCMNVVADAEGTATGCLIRAGEIVEGADLARERRSARGVTRRDRDLAQGPGRATVACGVTWEDNGMDLCTPITPGADLLDSPVFHVLPRDPERPTPVVATGPRIGLREEASDPGLYPWRFRILGDATVSGPAALNRTG